VPFDSFLTAPYMPQTPTSPPTEAPVPGKSGPQATGVQGPEGPTGGAALSPLTLRLWGALLASGRRESAPNPAGEGEPPRSATPPRSRAVTRCHTWPRCMGPVTIRTPRRMLQIQSSTLGEWFLVTLLKSTFPDKMKSFVIFSPDQVQNSNCFDDLIEILMALLEHDKNYVDSDKALRVGIVKIYC